MIVPFAPAAVSSLSTRSQLPSRLALLAVATSALAYIFDESWRALNEDVDDTVDSSTDGVSALEAMLGAIIRAFARDSELAYLFLFEGRRIHAGERDLVMSAGYFDFVGRLLRLVRRAQSEGSVAKELDSSALCSALIGAAEGMIRDRLIAQRAGRRPPFSERQVRTVFAAILRSVSGARRRDT